MESQDGQTTVKMARPMRRAGNAVAVVSVKNVLGAKPQRREEEEEERRDVVVFRPLSAM